jgi:hypothetical protein
MHSAAIPLRASIKYSLLDSISGCENMDGLPII